MTAILNIFSPEVFSLCGWWCLCCEIILKTVVKFGTNLFYSKVGDKTRETYTMWCVNSCKPVAVILLLYCFPRLHLGRRLEYSFFLEYDHFYGVMGVQSLQRFSAIQVKTCLHIIAIGMSYICVMQTFTNRLHSLSLETITEN